MDDYFFSGSFGFFGFGIVVFIVVSANGISRKCFIALEYCFCASYIVVCGFNLDWFTYVFAYPLLGACGDVDGFGRSAFSDDWASGSIFGPKSFMDVDWCFSRGAGRVVGFIIAFVDADAGDDCGNHYDGLFAGSSIFAPA